MTDLRRVILKCMLLSLAVAAAAGVLAALTTSHVIARATGTCFMTAIAALLMLPLSLMVDRKKLRTAGRCGIVVVSISFLLLLLMIWEVDRILPGNWDEDELAGAVGVVLLAGLSAMIFLRMLETAATRLAAWVGLAATAGFGLFGLIAIFLPATLTGAGWEVRWDLWLTAWTIMGFGALVAAALVGAGAGDRRHWRWIGVAANVIAAIVLIVHVWAGTGGDERIFTLFLATGVFVSWANLIVCVPLKSGQRWLRMATLGAGIATTLLTEIVVFEFIEFVARLSGAAAILAACGTLALAVLALLNRRINLESVATAFDAITVVCPACHKKQSIALGAAACKACGLRIEVRTSQPRCPECEYLLRGLTSDRCPECGTNVRGHSMPAAA